MRGEFIRGDGLVLPNNVTPYGAKQILSRAFQGGVTGFVVGLCNGVYRPVMTINDLDNPEYGVGGYLRKSLIGTDKWPTLDEINGEPYVETIPLIWEATGRSYSIPVTRLVIFDQSAPERVVAFGSPFPAQLLITPTTPEAQRTFRYRLYLR